MGRPLLDHDRNPGWTPHQRPALADWHEPLGSLHTPFPAGLEKIKSPTTGPTGGDELSAEQDQQEETDVSASRYESDVGDDLVRLC